MFARGLLSLHFPHLPAPYRNSLKSNYSRRYAIPGGGGIYRFSCQTTLLTPLTTSLTQKQGDRGYWSYHGRRFNMEWHPGKERMYRIGKLFPRAGFGELVEQVRLFTEDAREERLKLEPSCEMTSYLPPSGDRIGMIDLYRLTGSLREQLRMATSIHGDEPPGGLFHGFPP